jgi:hypothetical protein
MNDLDIPYLRGEGGLLREKELACAEHWHAQDGESTDLRTGGLL